ncbi:hypothetical protein J2755_000320 [Methanohalophilus levihalophilus]|uniref:hypothetical protein n=1 Tax=Methanohalophilus levihalophilus TaxID=1431282 RepID=UPI001AE34D30|nr:hypothetical protein [Methanohalophilus levihalophilus]MBP2029400.1 hypothetical protein [Methanohalophilus levihalophilus]
MFDLIVDILSFAMPIIAIIVVAKIDWFSDWFDRHFDYSPLQFEIKTRIPLNKLVNIIGDFYWNRGYKTGRIKIINPNKEEKEGIRHPQYTYKDYTPDFNLDDTDEIVNMSFGTDKKPNKQPFDSIYLEFDEGLNSVNIRGNFGIGFKKRHFILLIFAFFTTTYYAGLPLTSGFGSTVFFLLLVFLIFVFYFRRVRKVAKKPVIGIFKKEFEEHIRQKEKELTS